MREKIGISAGQIWEILQDNDKIAISKLSRMIGQNDTITYQALGWLAREGKIGYRLEGRSTYVSLIK